MGFFDSYYKNKFDKLTREMNELNKDMEETFKDNYSFSQYFDNAILIYDIYYDFESLKKKYKHFSYLESIESINNQINAQLRKKYESIVKLSQNDEYNLRKEKLIKLGEELRDCLDTECDSVINELINKNNLLLKDINENNNTPKVDEIRNDNIKNSKKIDNKTPILLFKKQYRLPSLDLLNKPAEKNIDNQIERNSEILQNTLKAFKINAKVLEVNKGPLASQYELEVQKGTRLSEVYSLDREISMALAKPDVVIETPIPGKSTIGIEIPNDEPEIISLCEVLQNVPKEINKNKLLVALGMDKVGNAKFCEIDKTPHLLVSGTTGSGMSTCINCIITSLLMRTKPYEVKLVLIDPKRVELSNYNGVPHLLIPVITDSKKASVVLQKIVNEMDNRYDEFSRIGVKNIAGYNEWVEKENKARSDEDKIMKMPYIVVIIDELSDLMLISGREVEDSIMRLTQKARASGIHLIIATQRPSVDVITGVIKANIPSRIALTVSSQIDSRTILDMKGAEKLIGNGDMLFLQFGELNPDHIQGALITDEEIKRVIEYTDKQQIAEYDDRWFNIEDSSNKDFNNEDLEDDDDDLYNDVVEFVITSGKASASLLQRRFKIGYNRAAHLVDLLEERGIIGPQNGSKPREVLVKLEDN